MAVPRPAAPSAPTPFLEVESVAPMPRPPAWGPWLLPLLLGGVTGLCAIATYAMPLHNKLWWFVPFSFLGNSLAMIPYDGAVIYLGEFYPLWVVVAVGTLATMLVEVWNMELLSRLLARDGARRFREHKATRWTLSLYSKAPFFSLVATCALPIIPHYPMRVVATLARYSLWKYQGAVALGRSLRYAGLAAVGWAFPIPGVWIVMGSLILLLVALRAVHQTGQEETVPETAA
jgi:membrane protein YqaA with SNARE-associated domain